ncbi:hypothetical protein ULMA_16740 [Patiriisocius marinus]|uniref:Uncharacterized protein n=1 Tax=Patiriisocius marinus TaxID=1397112 RepID=A0A5J4IXA0_9FLAO|nr:hypothetical protein ULMA_16740 [Patiriisocius marinus]
MCVLKFYATISLPERQYSKAFKKNHILNYIIMRTRKNTLLTQANPNTNKFVWNSKRRFR